MRSILLEGNDDLAALLPDLFNRAGITLVRVRTEQMLLLEANSLRANDFLLLDCSQDETSQWEQCARIVRATSLPIYIIHPPGKCPAHLANIARGPIQWIAADFGILPLLDKLRALCFNPPLPLAAGHMLLSQQEQRVLDLLVKGYTNAQIAEALGIREGTVKTYVSRMYIKWGVETREELIRTYHWMCKATTVPKTLVTQAHVEAQDTLMRASGRSHASLTVVQ